MVFWGDCELSTPYGSLFSDAWASLLEDEGRIEESCAVLWLSYSITVVILEFLQNLT